jgi:hypothetical protein
MNEISSRELKISEIIREAFGIFKANFKLILPLCLLAFIPLNILVLILGGEELVAAILTNPIDALLGGQAGAYLRITLITQFVRLLFTSLIVGGYTYLALSRYAEKEVTFQGMMDSTFGKWLGIVFTGLLFYLIILSVSFLIIPVIYFSVIFVFHRHVAAISNERGIRAFITSAVMVRGKFFKRLLYAAAFLLLQAGFTFIVTLFLGGLYPDGFAGEDTPLWAGIIIVILNVLVDSLTSIFSMAQAVWFVNILLTKKAIPVGTAE